MVMCIEQSCSHDLQYKVDIVYSICLSSFHNHEWFLMFVYVFIVSGV